MEECAATSHLCLLLKSSLLLRFPLKTSLVQLLSLFTMPLYLWVGTLYSLTCVLESKECYLGAVQFSGFLAIVVSSVKFYSSLINILTNSWCLHFLKTNIKYIQNFLLRYTWHTIYLSLPIHSYMYICVCICIYLCVRVYVCMWISISTMFVCIDII